MKVFTILGVLLLGIGLINGFVPNARRIGTLTPSSSTLIQTNKLASNQPKLLMSSKSSFSEIKQKEEELQPGPFDITNGVALTVWISLITWAFVFAPGSLGSDADSALVTKLISQPTPRPEDVNEIYFAIWNCFAIVPAVLAALTAPSGRGQRLPAAPFLWGSAFFGYFALGPYFATRTIRTDPIPKEDLGWVSQTIFENRVFGILLSVIAISIPFSADLFVSGFDFPKAVADLSNLFLSSRFVAVSMIDIILMSILSSILVAEDCKRRGWEDKSLVLLLGTLLFPVIGPSLYLAIRPSSK